MRDFFAGQRGGHGPSGQMVNTLVVMHRLSPNQPVVMCNITISVSCFHLAVVGAELWTALCVGYKTTQY